jgi:hypothetical protein
MRGGGRLGRLLSGFYAGVGAADRLSVHGRGKL